jgi:hypothetical protein
MRILKKYSSKSTNLQDTINKIKENDLNLLPNDEKFPIPEHSAVNFHFHCKAEQDGAEIAFQSQK